MNKIYVNKPFLRWAGSKKQLLPTISEYWCSEHKRYIEPFAGSAALFFKLNPKSAILGDINQELIITYSCIKNDPLKVSEYLIMYPNSPKEYYRIRDLNLESLNVFERAAIFIYLNRYCFNGLYRTNRKGKFNVPYGGDKSGQLPSKEQLRFYSHILRNTKFVLGDFEKTLSLSKIGDFIYLDPPYSVKSIRIFKEYHSKIFSNLDIERLRLWIKHLTVNGIEFLLSYANSDEGNYLKKDFEYKVVNTKRHIAGFSSNRRIAEEILISNKSLIN